MLGKDIWSDIMIIEKPLHCGTAMYNIQKDRIGGRKPESMSRA